MTITKLTNMIDPEVMADMISAELPNAIRFAPIATVDTTLEGRPGSTLTVPKFQYIGDAEDVAEGAEIDMALLQTSSADFTIKKAGKGVEVTDEAVLSGLGDPLGEARRQLTLAIANKIDNDMLEALGTAKLKATVKGLTVDGLSDALDAFDDEDDVPMILFLNPKDAATLRKSVANDWERASDLGDQVIVNGTYGGVLGCQVVRSRKITKGTGYVVKPGALKIFMKRQTMVESDRDIKKKQTIFTADQHYGAYLYDDSKAIKLTITAAPSDLG